MTRYKHVLFAADFIEEDDKAVGDRAVQIARDHNAKISVIHVVEHPYHYGTPSSLSLVAEWEEEMEKSAKHHLDQLADTFRIPEEGRLLPSGNVQAMIVETAKAIGADLIVVGSHGRHGLSLLLLGSTSNTILQSAKCDVLTVRVPERV
jgi:universal stress protein A